MSHYFLEKRVIYTFEDKEVPKLIFSNADKAQHSPGKGLIDSTVLE